MSLQDKTDTDATIFDVDDLISSSLDEIAERCKALAQVAALRGKSIDLRAALAARGVAV